MTLAELIRRISQLNAQNEHGHIHIYVETDCCDEPLKVKSFTLKYSTEEDKKQTEPVRLILEG
jgi:hypothetical protein